MQHKILVVDDEPDIVQVVQWCLASAGREIIVANTGQEALKVVKTAKPDLVILDAALPGMDGFEVLGQLKGNVSTTHIPVIMLTARDRDADVRKGQKQGCDFYLTKPFNPRELSRLAKLALEH